MILTLKSLKSFITHIFLDPSKLGIRNCNIEYILTGKLQTDILEKRFGTYQQLNGSSYHMTLKEVLSAEKKLRIRTAIKLGSTNFDLSQFDSKIINETAKGDQFINLDQSFTELARPDELLDKPSSFSRLELELDIELIKKLGSSSARFSIFVKSSARARLDLFS